MEKQGCIAWSMKQLCPEVHRKLTAFSPSNGLVFINSVFLVTLQNITLVTNKNWGTCVFLGQGGVILIRFSVGT